MKYEQAKNPLIRDGTEQQQRQMAALAPDSTLVDEQDLADFLVFAHTLNQRVAYYNLENKVEGDWQAFFERSTPVQIALISKTRPEEIQNQYNQALKQFLAQWAIAPAASPSSPEQRLEKLETVLNIYTQILDTLRTWAQGLAEGTPLKSTIYASVRANLSAVLQQLFRLEQGMAIQRQPAHLPESGSTNKSATNIRTSSEQFAEVFGLPLPPKPQPGTTSTGMDDRPLTLNLRQMTTNRLQAQTTLNAIFQPLFQTYLRIIQLAPAALHQSFTVDQKLTPHVALYVAFWQVLKPARDDLNRMTQRHLDFFYREVLRLSEQSAQPDRAHIILELAKFQQTYKLENQIRLSAGNDATGVERFYTLNDEIVVNTAQVAELKGVFLHSRAAQTASGSHAGQEILGLHISPVANSADGQGGKFPQDQAIQAWLPFGDATRPAAEVGLAIASNLLLLQEGDRRITFKLRLRLPSAPSLSKEDLKIDFSGKADWLPAEIRNLSLLQTENSSTDYTLLLEAHLPVDAEAVVPYHTDLPGARFATDRPVARLIVRHQDDHQDDQLNSKAVSAYHYLHGAELRAIDLSVEVRGVRNLLLQNDLTTLDATKPFLPFGVQPKVGTSFYIGNQEVFQKPLTDLEILFDLETDPPAKQDSTNQDSTHRNWEQIYIAYGVTNDKFNPGKMMLHALRERQWRPDGSGVERDLFSENASASSATSSVAGNSGATTTAKYRITLKDAITTLKLDNLVEKPSNAAGLEPWNYESQYGFLRLQLSGDDFRHTEYPTVLARQVLATATQEIIEVDGVGKKRKAVIGAYYEHTRTTPPASDASGETTPPASDASDETTAPATTTASTETEILKATTYYVDLLDVAILPGEPYTPVIKSLQINYEATATDQDCQLFHLYPFDGTASLPALPQDEVNQSPEQAISFLPEFEHEGELLIGLQNLEPLTSLCLLFQVAEETADTNLKRASVEWYYLKDNTWKLFEKHLILKDTSKGLIHSGIVKLAIPADISNAQTTILNSALHWIKVSVAPPKNQPVDQPVYKAICQIITIQTQAAEVTFTDAGNDPNHLATPLPAESITKLANPQPEIKQIRQPFPSFDGKVKEQPSHFYTRISEHLRHKGRAINIFGYERLVLDRFPEIYKVRCINHGRIAEDGDLREIAPGHVTLAVIPALSQRRTFNDLEPQVNINLLDEIQQYLEAVASPWVEIRVVNPRYEKLKVRMQVQFRQPFQADFLVYQRQLKQEITGFLSPWTVDTGAEIYFGGEIYPSSILNFVEKRPYVDYVLDFQLFQLYEQGQSSVRKATVSTAQSILVSVPPEEHVIEQVPETTSIGQSTDDRGLGYTPLERLL